MAKSKKPESKEATPAAEKPKAKAAGGKKAAAASSPSSPAAAAAAKPQGASGGGLKKSAKTPKSGASSPTAAPLIDTGLAARAAAAMVANRIATGPSPEGAPQQQPQPESSTFRNLKESLGKPSPASLGGILGTGGGQKKFSPHFGGGKQSGPGTRNQTFGADVNRTGVPRRTSG